MPMNKDDFYLGKSFDAYTYFGAHLAKGGVQFRTYAPGAEKVSVIGEFNDWQEEEMEQNAGGVHSFFSPEAKVGQMYKYTVHTKDGRKIDHCDPYGFGMELRPNSASYIVDLTEYTFSDSQWMAKRDLNYDKPMNIYEIHFGSWKTNPQDENGWYRYYEIADELISYVKKYNFTHIEVMPLSEHPADESWGYQNTGFFSPTARYGTARDLMEFVDKCHRAGVGVILDFVPVHFAMDAYGLAMYDGTALYEYPPSDVETSEWGTHNFIYSRGEVASFLQSAAHYWLEEYHFDGLRMDAISRAIYWLGDPRRGVNDKAVDFIKNMNDGLTKRHPSAMLFAEDSTAFPKVTVPVEYGGLGFHYKWDLGWMNDTLDYFRTPPVERPRHYHKITFSMQYFYNELFLLPFSHDESVHGKATIIQKMWGADYENKFKQCRALYLYMFAHPGKKLNFMGNEFAQFREWDEKREQDWDILSYPIHDAFHRYFQTLGRLYAECPALYVKEYDPAAFRWLEADAPDKSVYIFERKAGGDHILAAFNFSDQDWKDYSVAIKAPLRELICSNDQAYGGDAVTDASAQNKIGKIDLPAFTGRLFQVERKKDD